METPVTTSPSNSPAVLRIAMNGVTGRMGYRQHLVRSILPIRDQGGITLSDGRLHHPRSLFVNPVADLAQRARQHAVGDKFATLIMFGAIAVQRRTPREPIGEAIERYPAAGDERLVVAQHGFAFGESR